MKKEIKIQVHNKIFSGDRNDVFVDALLTENINGVTKKLDPYIRKIKKNSPGPIICFSSATPEMIYNDKSLSVDDAIKLLQATNGLHNPQKFEQTEFKKENKT